MIMPYILSESARGVQAIPITDRLYEMRKIFLTEPVTADTCDALLRQFLWLEMDDSDAEITFYINSPGGDVNSGLALYDYISQMHSPLRTVCTGMAASMGAILFLAGNKREMLPHTKLMIHDPSYAYIPGGQKPMELEKQLSFLMETREVLAKIISENTGKTLEEVYKATNQDSFFSAQQAVEYGLATGIAVSL